MYYHNNPQSPAPMAVYNGLQSYAAMPPQHGSVPQQSSYPQQRPVMPQQMPPNTQFMHVPAPLLGHNAAARYGKAPAPGMPHGAGYTTTQRHQVTPVPSNDERYRKQLIVNYLAPDVVSAELHELFSRFGQLDGARIIYDRQTNLPKGYGFVYFTRPEDAKAAVEQMNGYGFHGKKLKVGYSTNPLNIVSGAATQHPYGNIM